MTEPLSPNVLPEAAADAIRELGQLRQFMAARQFARAHDILERVFRSRPDFRDEYGHPVLLKESLRLALAERHLDRAREYTVRLQALLPPNDPLVPLLYARHHAAAGELEAAGEAWRTVLARNPEMAEARQWIAAHSPKPNTESLIGGIADIAFTNTNDLGRFALDGRDERLALFEAVEQLPQLPLHDEPHLDSNIVAEHHRRHPAHDIAVYALTDAVMAGTGLLMRGDSFFHRLDCLPAYYRGWVGSKPPHIPVDLQGSVFDADAETIRVDEPVAVAMHPNLVWGHFLVEVLPRLFLVSLLAKLGRPFKLAVPTTCPGWFQRFLTDYGAAGGYVEYDPKRQRIAAPCFVVPGMMQQEWALSPLMNLMISDLVARCGLRDEAVPDGPRLLYFSRAKFWGPTRLRNESQVEELLRGMGFTVVHPETLEFAEQMRLFRGAEVIVAEYGSVLHNAIFARQGTRVVAINRHNWLQGEIARLRRQHVAYVKPADGVWRVAGHTGEQRHFDVDLKVLQRTVEQMLAAPSVRRP